MATFTNLLPKLLTSTSSRQIRGGSPITSSTFSFSYTKPITTTTYKSIKSLNHRNHHHHHLITPRASTTPSDTTTTTTTTTTATTSAVDRVKRIHNIDEFDEALRLAKNKLVVVEYATAKSIKTEKIYPFMVELSRTCADVVFLLIVGDESDRTIAICKREKVQHSPHFTFYKNSVKIHEEEAIGPDMLVGDVLYYGDSHSKVIQIHSGEDVQKLIDENNNKRNGSDVEEEGKLIVLDVGLKHCGPCVKVYPTVIKLSQQMEDSVVFARMNGDENDSCMKFLKEMNVVEVPTFLFIRDGEIVGRYVGSGKGELIGEILRYQGVRVTY